MRSKSAVAAAVMLLVLLLASSTALSIGALGTAPPPGANAAVCCQPTPTPVRRITVDLSLERQTGWTGGKSVDGKIVVTNKWGVVDASKVVVDVELTWPSFVTLTKISGCNEGWANNICSVSDLNNSYTNVGEGDDVSYVEVEGTHTISAVFSMTGTRSDRGRIAATGTDTRSYNFNSDDSTGYEEIDPSASYIPHPEDLRADSDPFRLITPKVTLKPTVAKPGDVIYASASGLPPGTRAVLAWSAGVSRSQKITLGKKDTRIRVPLLLFPRDDVGWRDAELRSADGRFGTIAIPDAMLVVPPPVAASSFLGRW